MTHDPHESHVEVHILMLQNTHLFETQGIHALEMEFYVMKDNQTSHGLWRSAGSRKAFRGHLIKASTLNPSDSMEQRKSLGWREQRTGGTEEVKQPFITMAWEKLYEGWEMPFQAPWTQAVIMSGIWPTETTQSLTEAQLYSQTFTILVMFKQLPVKMTQVY